MGTRALTVVQENDKDVIVMYRQYDGYPDGHGQELADFLKGITLGNGISGDKAMGTFANGMGCLAAQIVAHFKTEAGGFYLYPGETRDCGEEYTYIVTARTGKPWIAIHEGTVAFFGQPGRIPASEMRCIWEGFADEFESAMVKPKHH
jgi:hypothetical protein